jgi:K+-sensing histidine kinase KdpD
MRKTRLSRELYALTEISKTITLAIDLPELLKLILEKIIGVMDQADNGVIMLWDQPSGLFRPWASFGYDLDIFKKFGLHEGESVTGKVFTEGRARLLSSPQEVAQAMQDMRPANRSIHTRALGTERLPICTVAAPIAVKDQKYGVLVLETLEGPSVFTQKDLPFVQTLADLIALAIERARLSVIDDVAQEAQKAERLRTELMGVLSHELRLPLTAIQGYTTALLLDEVEWSEDKKKEFLRLIEEECHHMEIMLKDILDSSLIDVDQLAIERQPVRLDQIAHEVASEIQHRTEIHNIVVDFPVDFPIVEADPQWIRQVFRNILDNSVKYSPEGGLVIIRGEIRPSDIVISVSDQGIGIPPENMISLFEKYFRVKSPAGLQIPGTGLGLQVARTIVEAHGGHIWAESEFGHGTTFSFSVPYFLSSKMEKDERIIHE